MNGKCFDMGTIQAFLDGETTPDMSLRLTTHVANCDACALLLAEAEEESSVVFSTLGRELDTLVPTQRLWSRINETIEVEKGRVSPWQRFLGYVTASLASPSIAAAAGLLVAVGLFAVLITRPDAEIIVDIPKAPTNISRTADPATQQTGEIAQGNEESESSPVPTVNFSNHSAKKVGAMVVQANARSTQREIMPAVYAAPAADAYLPGEESYVKTIADLKPNVDEQKETVLTPSSRVSYERDMAVVNDSINRMREVVRKNPRSQSARQVLYSSYQDKIDLLNSVAQREELIASIR